MGRRGALPEDCAALQGWATDSPLLVLGSHTWNLPDAQGKMTCDGPRQGRLFEAATARCTACQQAQPGSAARVHHLLGSAAMNLQTPSSNMQSAAAQGVADACGFVSVLVLPTLEILSMGSTP